MEGKKRLTILVVEDDPNDALLLQRAFKKNGIAMPLHICADALDAIAYLKGEGKYKNRAAFPFPRVLITDLKMPRFSGFDLLEWLEKQPECGVLPIIVFSASSLGEDVVRAYKLGANCYFQKPSTFEELVALARLVNEFWIKAVVPPLPAEFEHLPSQRVNAAA